MNKKIFKDRTKEGRFKKGHNKGGPTWNKGLSVSAETRQKIKKNNAKYWLNKTRSKKTKEKISKKLKGRIVGHKWGKREKHYNWKGGSSFEPYGVEFNDSLKETVRNRDRRKCQMCGKIELEEGHNLSIHHIDYNKKNNNPNNLITLCNSCHVKTNINRKKWIRYFNKKRNNNYEQKL